MTIELLKTVYTHKNGTTSAIALLEISYARDYHYGFRLFPVEREGYTSFQGCLLGFSLSIQPTTLYINVGYKWIREFINLDKPGDDFPF